LVAVGCVVVPFCSRLAVALLIFLIMGAARGVSVVGVNTGLMEVVPQHYMGRVQNTFAMFSRLAQILIAVGLAIVARNAGLIAAFCGLAMVYLLAAAAAGAAGSPPVYSKESVTQMATAETI
jgi:hypothetical protein